jgi:hypothetical protein
LIYRSLILFVFGLSTLAYVSCKPVKKTTELNPGNSGIANTIEEKVLEEPQWEKAHPDVELMFRKGAALPLSYTIYRMDTQVLGDWLRRIPKMKEPQNWEEAGKLSLPNPEGELQSFDLLNSPVMAPELAAKFPEIMTFSGKANNQAATSLQCEFTPRGFTAQILSTKETYLIEPLENQGMNLYIVFRKTDMVPVKNKQFPEGNSR